MVGYAPIEGDLAAGHRPTVQPGHIDRIVLYRGIRSVSFHRHLPSSCHLQIKAAPVVKLHLNLHSSTQFRTDRLTETACRLGCSAMQAFRCFQKVPSVRVVAIPPAGVNPALEPSLPAAPTPQRPLLFRLQASPVSRLSPDAVASTVDLEFVASGVTGRVGKHS
jgi:hypothetical protein